MSPLSSLSCVIVSVISSHAVDRRFEPRVGSNHSLLCTLLVFAASPLTTQDLGLERRLIVYESGLRVRVERHDYGRHVTKVVVGLVSAWRHVAKVVVGLVTASLPVR
jgi:hypothetical protein